MPLLCAFASRIFRQAIGGGRQRRRTGSTAGAMSVLTTRLLSGFLTLMMLGDCAVGDEADMAL